MHTLIAQGTTASTGSKTVDLSSSWGKIWTALSNSTGFSKLQWVITVVGIILILSSLLRYLWSRRTGGGQGGHQPVFWTLFVGAILMLPQVLIPVILTVADAIINAISGIAGQ
jgi:hypothetical protein